MRHLTILIFVLTTTILFGQEKVTIDQKQRELVKNDFLTSLYLQLTVDYQEIERAELPIPYFIGDEFVLTKSLWIGEINPDGTIPFDKGSLIPAGYKLKLLSKEGLFYSVRATDQNGDNKQNGVIPETNLKSYFDSGYIGRKSRFFDDYKDTIDSLAKRIGEKYKLTPDEVMRIVNSYVTPNKN